MKILKIQFADFWFGFEPANNYFFNLLSSVYQLELSDDPMLLIYCCYGLKHLKYDCIKIFYTSENFRPDYSGCDFAIGFDYSNDPRHYRLPLYAFYLDYEKRMEKMVSTKSREEALQIWRSKSKFCCMVVSNEASKRRLQFFDKLSKYKTVDSGGKVMNNIGGPVKNKMAFIRDYRFVFAFENNSYPGYTTEKIVEPFLTDSIPVYWGDPLISSEFNELSFLNLDKSKTDEELIEDIVAIDNSEELAVSMLSGSKFKNAKIPPAIDREKILRFFNRIIQMSENKKPVSKTWKRYIHFYRLKKIYYRNRLKGILKTT